MKILILAGTGFIGAEVSKQLVNRGHDVTVFHRPNKSNISYNEIHGDYNDKADLSRAINETMPDVIIHMRALCKENIKSLESALNNQKIKVIIISSCDVYKAYDILCNGLIENIIQTPLDENAEIRSSRFPYRGKIDSDFAYDYDKVLVEETALSSHIIDPIILRLGMVYGPADYNRRFANIVSSMRNQDASIEIPSDLANMKFSKGYVENIAYGIVLATESKEHRKVYNLAERTSLSELQWHNLIAEKLDWHGSVKLVNYKMNSMNFSQHFTIDSSKIRKELGYKEIVSLENGIEKTIQWELVMISSAK
ncbi:dTDP-glucose 4,6-dehydratase [Vibrio stylophorae]|uniref:dTDP-glucose 4,6-dehydratase n=1 Tax=Vibrio stylophorae TaxID=659351 RepID=A0ABM8ZSR0_9VIBR|nr:NAD-dependent epimerase/dehydratase family protein [Vibrio stylophorae]CAH0533349.1 dTDP-glucose 4,6-dehydratase [Vibrio stylophorae]